MIYHNRSERENKKYLMSLAVVFIVNPISHYIQNVVGFGNTYYFSYVCWLFLFMVFFGKRNIKIMGRTFYVTVLLLISFAIGSIWGYIYFNTGFSEFHTSIMVCIAYLITMGAASEISINELQLRFLMQIIVLIGIVASLYAMITQTAFIIPSLRGINLTSNSWQYVSFFRQRNIFAGYCFTASIAGCFMFFSSKKIRYALCVLLFGFQIFITNSRAALLAYVILVGLCIYQTRRNKIVFTAVAVVTILALFYAFDFVSIITERFLHSTSTGQDSSMIRLNMWIDCIIELFDKFAFLFGFGAGSTTNFLTPVYGVGSSHNAYVDMFFTGGAVYLGIVIHSIVCAFKNICSKGGAFYTVWLSAMIAFCTYSMLEAGMALYASNYFSVTLTVLLVLIPRLFQNEPKLLKERESDREPV